MSFLYVLLQILNDMPVFETILNSFNVIQNSFRGVNSYLLFSSEGVTLCFFTTVPFILTWLLLANDQKNLPRGVPDNSGKLLAVFDVKGLSLWISYFFFLGVGILNMILMLFELAEFTVDIMVTLQSVLCGLSLMFATFEGGDLGNVLFAYMIGMCNIHFILDTVHFLPLGRKAVLPVISIVGTVSSSIFGIAAEDSYPPLTRLNIGYVSSLLAFIIGLIFVQMITRTVTVTPTRGTKGHFVQPIAKWFSHENNQRIVVVVASVCQIVFCTVSSHHARKVDGKILPNSIRLAFTITTYMMYVLANIVSIFRYLKARRLPVPIIGGGS